MLLSCDLKLTFIVTGVRKVLTLDDLLHDVVCVDTRVVDPGRVILHRILLPPGIHRRRCQLHLLKGLQDKWQWNGMWLSCAACEWSTVLWSAVNLHPKARETPNPGHPCSYSWINSRYNFNTGLRQYRIYLSYCSVNWHYHCLECYHVACLILLKKLHHLTEGLLF